MGFVLDSIVKTPILTGPETISSDFISEAASIGGIEGDFAIQFVYDGGASVNMTLALEVSVDGINYVEINDSSQVIIDDSGVHIWDAQSSGATFVRVTVTVVSGSIDVQSIQLSGKRRH